MGVIRKESTLSTLSAYLGAALGFVNKIILLPRFFDLDQVGLLNVSINLSMTLAQLALLGYGAITVKYFPYYKDKENGHNGFLVMGFMFGLVGFIIMSTIFYLNKETILNHLSTNSELLVEYYYIIFIVGFFFLGFNIYTYYLQVLFKTYVVSLIRDVGLRVMVTASIFLYASGLVNFEVFVWIFTLINCSIAIIIMIYVSWLKQNFLGTRIRKGLRKGLKGIIGYGFISFLGAASYYTINTVDAIMVADMVSLEKAGVYTTYMYLATFMLFPYRALTSISSPQVGELWKANDIDGLQKLYKRVSFLGLLFGLILFFGIWINRHNFVKLTTPEFAGAEITLLFLALSKLIDIVSGLNTYILITSKMFKYDLFMNLGLMVLSIVLNIYLIRLYGIDGAALATLISMSIFQIGRILFLYFAYKLNPFDVKMLPLLLFAGIAYAADFLIPIFDPFWLDIAARSLLFGIIYGGFVYFTKISSDVNRLVDMAIGKVFKKS